MRTTQQFSVTLTNEMAEMVRARVASGAYASESEVIREGLRALNERDKVVEEWLANTAAPALDALRKDPTRARSKKQILDTIRAEK
ncbi:TPA: type II toxin-antitoxin system ParD family antitoxin [Salmonella enterica]|uniref:Antitoxin ParD n=1 Tax=Salmonella enterica TaxID=28901 RepID=A0A754B846_SALER|nr:type II toxin-antitoxin system ParD family antitoxin [Salmonella enterica]ECU9162028.1 type II toxin-antitoxin system ParD family antitoxin [Salmonella enterica subsp. enterica serovar Newport str. CFSAN000599]EDU1196889.1 type II toxin-antitoxin system ParD family antitoxin [Salmonella enterica subsp. enterica serovar Heidelberg str. CFSAN000576]HAF8579416.1 type II toxin-antitoxin system ParD family antitoxin [Salmonella enterica]